MRRALHENAGGIYKGLTQLLGEVFGLLLVLLQCSQALLIPVVAWLRTLGRSRMSGGWIDRTVDTRM